MFKNSQAGPADIQASQKKEAAISLRKILPSTQSCELFYWLIGPSNSESPKS